MSGSAIKLLKFFYLTGQVTLGLVAYIGFLPLSLPAWAGGDIIDDVKKLTSMTCKQCDNALFEKRVNEFFEQYLEKIQAAGLNLKPNPVSLTDSQVKFMVTQYLKTHSDTDCIDAIEIKESFEDTKKDNFTQLDLLNWNTKENHKAGVGAEIVEFEKTVLEKISSDAELGQLTNAFENCTGELTGEGEKKYQELVNSLLKASANGNTINAVILSCSGNTYRNTCGEANEVISAIDLSQKRCDSLKARLIAEPKLAKLKLNADNIDTHPEGEHGDGTSGPNPFDVPFCSGDTDLPKPQPHATREEYNQHKYAKFSISYFPAVGTPVKKNKKYIKYYTPVFRCYKTSSNSGNNGLVGKDKVKKGSPLPCPYKIAPSGNSSFSGVSMDLKKTAVPMAPNQADSSKVDTSQGPDIRKHILNSARFLAPADTSKKSDNVKP